MNDTNNDTRSNRRTARARGFEHEQVCLSALIIGGWRPTDLRLMPDDFGDPANRAVWGWAVELEAAGKPFDVPGLQAAARADRGGGEDLLDRVIDRCTSHYQLANDHAEQVRMHAQRRRFRAAAIEVLEADRRNPDQDPADFIGEWAPELQRALDAHGGSHLIGAGDAMKKAIVNIAEMMKGERIGFRIGVPKLDKVLGGGLPARRLCVLAAPTANGKTTLAVQAARSAGRQGRPVLIISMEMSAAEVIQRSTLTDARLCEADLVGRKLTKDDSLRLARAIDEAGRDFNPDTVTFIEDPLRPRDMVGEIRAWSRRFEGPGLVIIDYLQLCKPSEDKASRERQIAEIIGVAKREIASGLGHATLCISQLNRGGSSDKGPPELHHLRESGAIEQFAESAVLIYKRDREQGEQGEQGEYAPVWFKVAKNRYGPSNLRIAGGFDVQRGKFFQVDTRGEG